MALFGGGGFGGLLGGGLTGTTRGGAGRGARRAAEKERLKVAQKDVSRFLQDNPEVQREQLAGDVFAQAALVRDPRRSADFVSGIIARNRARQVAGQRGIRANILTSPLGLARNAGA